jgi:hypothetical protein
MGGAQLVNSEPNCDQKKQSAEGRRDGKAIRFAFACQHLWWLGNRIYGDGRITRFQMCDEAVSASRNRLHKARRVYRISQYVPQLVDRFVETAFVVDERSIRPKPLNQFLATD